jgi:hypothetical protein
VKCIWVCTVGWLVVVVWGEGGGASKFWNNCQQWPFSKTFAAWEWTLQIFLLTLLFKNSFWFKHWIFFLWVATNFLFLLVQCWLNLVEVMVLVMIAFWLPVATSIKDLMAAAEKFEHKLLQQMVNNPSLFNSKFKWSESLWSANSYCTEIPVLTLLRSMCLLKLCFQDKFELAQLFLG